MFFTVKTSVSCMSSIPMLLLLFNCHYYYLIFIKYNYRACAASLAAPSFNILIDLTFLRKGKFSLTLDVKYNFTSRHRACSSQRWIEAGGRASVIYDYRKFPIYVVLCRDWFKSARGVFVGRPTADERDARNGALRAADAHVLDIHIRLAKQLDDFIAVRHRCILSPSQRAPKQTGSCRGESAAVPVFPLARLPRQHFRRRSLTPAQHGFVARNCPRLIRFCAIVNRGEASHSERILTRKIFSFTVPLTVQI